MSNLSAEDQRAVKAARYLQPQILIEELARLLGAYKRSNDEGWTIAPGSVTADLARRALEKVIP